MTPAHAQQSPSTAEYCGDCHREIFDGWKQSAHAAAMESRLFQDALKMAGEDFGEAGRKACLACHSPVGVMLEDFSLLRKVSWEGITCDYCHSIREVTLSGGNPKARVEFSEVKSGPSKEAVSPAHGTVFSKVHTSSLACVSCHEYRNALGFPVLTTYAEWKESPYAKEGKQCQSCHMYTVRGAVVDPRVKRSSQDEINFHQMPGSRSVEQLNKAIHVALSAERKGDKLEVTVKLTNSGAGHYVPTGSPLRQLILEVRAEPYGGGQTFREQRVYMRRVADQKGAPVEREHFAFLRGAKVLEDTRLAPRETRSEKFSFPILKGRQARVVADFYYYYSPMASTAAQQKVKFLAISRMVQ
ncbi:MAG: hypothetical protein M1453_06865 [Acidobacteria bacterium]|nr:hypothetical protein [Acidobacteriota bacterium]MCL5287699.1 hypothetical protein [Acidobacteriota bacterium]